MASFESNRNQDWVGNSRAYLLAWGLPGIILVAGIFLDPSTRTVLWVGALVWKGMACVVNAARCGRTHCYFTGPYFLILAIVTALHGYQILWLGGFGWVWLGLMIVAGGGALWVFTEKAWGKFFHESNDIADGHTVNKCLD